MAASFETTRGKQISNHAELHGSTRPDMIFGAVAALILDYAAVAAVIGLFLLERWLGIRLGRTLDLLLVVVVVAVVALSVVAWLAGSRLDLRLAHVSAHHADATKSR